MDSLKFTLIIIALVLIFVSIESVSALPPSIPVIVKGRVLSSEGKPVPDALVTLSWQNENEELMIISTKTNNINSDASLIGYYSFDEKDIVVQPQTKLTVESYGNKVDVSFDKPILSADIILSRKIIDIIPQKNTKIQKKSILESIKNFLYSFFSKSDDTKINVDENSKINESYYSENSLNKNNDNNNSAEEKNTINEINSSSGIGTSNISGNTNGTSNISGNAKGNMSDDENTTSNGSINNGENSQNSDNAPGYYETDSNKSNNRLNLSQPIQGRSGVNVYSNKTIYYPDEKKSISLVILASIMVFVILLILGQVFFGFLTYIFNKIKRSINLNTSFNEIINITGTVLRNKNTNYLDIDDKISDAIDIFIENTITAIPVLSSDNIVGVLTKKDIIEKLNDGDYETLEKTRIEKIINKKYISCSPEKKLEDIYMLIKEKKLNYIILKEGPVFIGIMDYFDILKAFLKSNFIIDNPPSLYELQKKQVPTVEFNIALDEVRDKLLNHKEEYIIITRDKKPIGILATKNMIEAIKQRLDFKKSKAINIMSPNLISMVPGNTIYEAFDVMIGRRFNQIPLIVDDKLIGIVTIQDLVDFYFNLLKQVTNKKSYEKVDDKK